MKSTVEIDAEKPEKLIEVLRPSLSSDETVEYVLTAEEDSVKIEVDTEGLGPLRGCTDTVFRLTSLAEKLY